MTRRTEDSLPMLNWTDPQAVDDPFIHARFVSSSDNDLEATQSQGSEPLPATDQPIDVSNFEYRGYAINVGAAGQDAQAQDTQQQQQQAHEDWSSCWPPSTLNPAHSVILGAPQASGSAHLDILGSGGQQQQGQGSLYGHPYSFPQHVGYSDYTREQVQHPQAGLGFSYLQVRYSAMIFSLLS